MKPIFINIFKDDVSPIVNNYYGLYFRTENDIENVVKYYQKAADCGYLIAIQNLTSCYPKHDIKLAKPFGKKMMAVELRDLRSIHELICYYLKNCDEIGILKYYTIAIQSGHNRIVDMVINYYRGLRDNDEAMEYTILAADRNNILLRLSETNPNIFDDIKYVEKILLVLYKLIKKSDITSKLIKIIDSIDIKHFDCAPKLPCLYKQRSC